ncbi:hypothetical protein RCF98_07910 [Thiothrix lacustris]|uniref:Uncharacterized protein n=1 Tax=Thiothrix lacustris TaxID=525917 RepID=A0ABY9MUQ2_9GAMM|nr:hypothetical protein [Thiothrix lacustris]WML92253.1 hypothetical protein RCF98_07910 [Thiothrix lacustris]
MLNKSLSPNAICWHNSQHPYFFNDIDTLIEDFLLEVDKWKRVELGLIERDTKGSLTCPYADIHVDMHIVPNLQAA